MENRSMISEIFVTVLQEEADGTLHCSVTVVLREGVGGHFGLHMSAEDFESLRDLEMGDVAFLAHRFLRTFKNVPLDPSQRDAWDAGYSEEGSG